MSDNKFPTAQTPTIIIPANSEIPVFMKGNYVRCLSATAGFKISPDDSREAVDIDQGLALEAEDGYTFLMLTLRNETGVAITTKLFIGRGKFHDSRLSTLSNVNVQNTAITPIYTTTANNIIQSQAQAVLTNAATTSIIGSVANMTGAIIKNIGVVDVLIGKDSTIGSLQGNGFVLKPNDSFSYDGAFPMRGCAGVGSPDGKVSYIRFGTV